MNSNKWKKVKRTNKEVLHSKSWKCERPQPIQTSPKWLESKVYKMERGGGKRKTDQKGNHLESNLQCHGQEFKL